MLAFILIGHSAQPGRQNCQLYAQAAIYFLGYTCVIKTNKIHFSFLIYFN